VVVVVANVFVETSFNNIDGNKEWLRILEHLEGNYKGIRISLGLQDLKYLGSFCDPESESRRQMIDGSWPPPSIAPGVCLAREPGT
jgi:hypothetical protein